MKTFVEQYVKKGDSVLDVGSYDVNGSYKPLFDGCHYLGIDIETGPNVDVVLSEMYKYPFPDNHFDVVVSGQCLEHTFHPWRAVNEIGRVVKHGGFVCLIAPWQWPIHRYPVDCFRILPDGMANMMKDAGLEVLSCTHSTAGTSFSPVENDCYGVGRKLLPILTP